MKQRPTRKISGSWGALKKLGYQYVMIKGDIADEPVKLKVHTLARTEWQRLD